MQPEDETLAEERSFACGWSELQGAPSAIHQAVVCKPSLGDEGGCVAQNNKLYIFMSLWAFDYLATQHLGELTCLVKIAMSYECIHIPPLGRRNSSFVVMTVTPKSMSSNLCEIWRKNCFQSLVLNLIRSRIIDHKGAWGKRNVRAA